MTGGAGGGGGGGGGDPYASIGKIPGGGGGGPKFLFSDGAHLGILSLY